MTRGIMVIGELFLVHYHTRGKMNYDKVGLNFQQDRLHISIVFACNKYCLKTISAYCVQLLGDFWHMDVLNHAHGLLKSHKTYNTRCMAVVVSPTHTWGYHLELLRLINPFAICLISLMVMDSFQPYYPYHHGALSK